MRYSQTEKEALAIAWGVEHFHLYVYGHEFFLVTDHKPLEAIYGNRNSKTSARIERWVLRLKPYSFTIKYKPNRENPVDYLSRHPTSTSLKQQKMTEAHIDMIDRASVPKTLTLEEIEAATNSDNTLRAVRAVIKMSKWHYDSVKSFKAFKDELTVTSKGIILRGTTIVMPHTLQQRVIDLAHTSHLRVTKTKALIREQIWFPGIGEMIKNTIAKCIPCQGSRNQRQRAYHQHRLLRTVTIRRLLVSCHRPLLRKSKLCVQPKHHLSYLNSTEYSLP